MTTPLLHPTVAPDSACEATLLINQFRTRAAHGVPCFEYTAAALEACLPDNNPDIAPPKASDVLYIISMAYGHPKQVRYRDHVRFEIIRKHPKFIEAGEELHQYMRRNFGQHTAAIKIWKHYLNEKLDQLRNEEELPIELCRVDLGYSTTYLEVGELARDVTEELFEPYRGTPLSHDEMLDRGARLFEALKSTNDTATVPASIQDWRLLVDDLSSSTKLLFTIDFVRMVLDAYQYRRYTEFVAQSLA